MNRISLFFLALSFVSVAKADSALSLKPFFGYFRTLEYNGVQNIDVRRFFMPSIHLTRSIVLKDEAGERMEILGFQFEVPVLEEEGLALRSIFTEMPLQSTHIQSSETHALLTFEGKIQERQGQEWFLCEASYRVEMSFEDSERLRIQFRKKATPPCRSESHEILTERIRI